MTSMPASRRARAMILAPRSCPSRPGLATTTRILRAVGVEADMRLPARREAPMGGREVCHRARSPVSWLAHADRHAHVRRVDDAEEPIGAAAGEPLAVA